MTAEPMTTFACCRFSGKRAQGAGDASLPRLARALFLRPGERRTLGLQAARGLERASAKGPAELGRRLLGP
jgi:hypothetical protein